MSFYGDIEEAKKCAHHASKQIDGLEPGETSPVREGAAPDGAFQLHMEGEKVFTDKRTRMREVGHVETLKRELHPVPLKKGSASDI